MGTNEVGSPLLTASHRIGSCPRPYGERKPGTPAAIFKGIRRLEQGQWKIGSMGRPRKNVFKEKWQCLKEKAS